MKFGLVAIEQLDFHRNGVSGNGFHCGIFRAADGSRYLAIRTEDDEDVGNVCCYVIELNRLPEHGIKFGLNSWRGDEFALEAAGLVAVSDAEDDIKNAWRGDCIKQTQAGREILHTAMVALTREHETPDPGKSRKPQ